MTTEVHLLEAACPQYSCVVDHHVETASGRLRELADPLCHFIGVGDVKVADDRRSRSAGDIRSCRSQSVDLVGQRLEPDLIDVKAADGEALSGECQRGRPADPGRGAGDEHGLLSSGHRKVHTSFQ